MSTISQLRRKSIFDQYGMNYGDEQARNPLEIIAGQDPTKDLEQITEPPPQFEEVGPMDPREPIDIALGRPTTNWRTKLDELYTPETQDTERFRNLLNDFPEREEPSFMRKLSASGATLGNVRRRIPGGIEQADKILDAPYNQELAEWKEKTGPMYNAANLERQSNIQERTLASNVLNAQTQGDRLALLDKQATERIRVQDEKNTILRFKAEHPNFTFDTNGVRIYARDPGTGKVHDLGPTGNWTAAEKALLGIAGMSFLQEQRDIAAGERQRTGLNARNTPQTGRQTIEERAAKVQEAYLTRPEWREFIEAGPDGSFRLKPAPSGSMFRSVDPTKVAEYNKLTEYVAGTSSGQGTTGTTSQTQQDGIPPKPAGMPSGPGIISQYHPERKQWRYSRDGGKTWQYSTGPAGSEIRQDQVPPPKPESRLNPNEAIRGRNSGREISKNKSFGDIFPLPDTPYDGKESPNAQIRGRRESRIARGN